MKSIRKTKIAANEIDLKNDKLLNWCKDYLSENLDTLITTDEFVQINDDDTFNLTMNRIFREMFNCEILYSLSWPNPSTFKPGLKWFKLIFYEKTEKVFFILKYGHLL